MNCVACSADICEGAGFCAECGTPVAAACVVCGNVISPSDKGVGASGLLALYQDGVLAPDTAAAQVDLGLISRYEESLLPAR